MAVIATMLAEIMDSPDFAEIMFLVAFILFLIEFIRIFALARNDGVELPLGSRRRWPGLPRPRLPGLTHRPNPIVMYHPPTT